VQHGIKPYRAIALPSPYLVPQVAKITALSKFAGYRSIFFDESHSHSAPGTTKPVGGFRFQFKIILNGKQLMPIQSIVSTLLTLADYASAAGKAQSTSSPQGSH
jgi:hypothetical protein